MIGTATAPALPSTAASASDSVKSKTIAASTSDSANSKAIAAFTSDSVKSKFTAASTREHLKSNQTVGKNVKLKFDNNQTKMLISLMGKLMEEEENPPKSIGEVHDRLIQKRGEKPKFWEDVAKQLTWKDFLRGESLSKVGESLN